MKLFNAPCFIVSPHTYHTHTGETRF